MGMHVWVYFSNLKFHYWKQTSTPPAFREGHSDRQKLKVEKFNNMDMMEASLKYPNDGRFFFIKDF